VAASVERASAVAPALLAAIVGAMTLDGTFVFDDYYAIATNPVVQGDVPASELLTRGFWGEPIAEGVRSYRPLVTAGWRGLATLGESALAFRVVSLLLHVLAVELARRWLIRRGWSVGRSAATAALFAVHPVNAEGVGAIVAHADLACVVFGLLALNVDLDRRAGPVLAAVAIAAAGLSKELFVVFALILFWREAAADRLAAPRRVGPAAAVTLALVALHLSLDRERAMNPMNNLGLAADEPGLQLAWGLAMIGRSVGLLVWPAPLSPVHDYASASLESASLAPWALAGALTLALSIWVGWVTRRSHADLRAAALMVMLPVLITSNLLFDTVTGLAERLLYLPALGACVLGVAGAGELADRIGLSARGRIMTWSAVVTGSVGVGAGPRMAWRSPIALWERAVEVTPRSMRAHSNLGAAYLNAQRVDEGVVHMAISEMILRRFPEPIADPPWLGQLEGDPAATLDAVPGLLVASADACEFTSAVLGVVHRTRPDVAAAVAPRWSRQYCPQASCPDDVVIEALHAVTFHLERGATDEARVALDQARRLAGPGPKPGLAKLLTHLGRVVDSSRRDPDGVQGETEQLRAFFSDWACLPAATHEAFHSRLSPVP
jgi:hypothetical protein